MSQVQDLKRDRDIFVESGTGGTFLLDFAPNAYRRFLKKTWDGEVPEFSHTLNMLFEE